MTPPMYLNSTFAANTSIDSLQQLNLGLINYEEIKELSLRDTTIVSAAHEGNSAVGIYMLLNVINHLIYSFLRGEALAVNMLK